jgi:hypothetical protein
MGGALPPLSHYAFMAWCSVKKKAQRQLYLRFTLAFCTERRVQCLFGDTCYIDVGGAWRIASSVSTEQSGNGSTKTLDKVLRGQRPLVAGKLA